MSMKTHVTKVCRSAYYHIRQIGNICRSLTRDACASAVRSAILSRIDYSNALLGGFAVTQLARLQRVQNMAARLIALKPKSDSITPVLCDLHWVHVKLRIVFKLCTYMYKGLHHPAPEYITNELSVYKPRRSLRSGNAGAMFSIIKTNKDKGTCDFAVTGPRMWNDLPPDVRESPSLETFRKRLKTYLFRCHYFVWELSHKRFDWHVHAIHALYKNCVLLLLLLKREHNS